MDKVNDFFNSIKDRLSNPLIFSFLISWVFINWQVTIGLLYYNSDQIVKLGYESYFCFIQHKVTSWFWWPFGIAVVYTISNPLVKIGISAIQTWANRQSETLNIRITKESKVSISKYIDLRKQLDERTKIIEEFYDKEKEILNDAETLKTENLKLTGEILPLKEKVKKLEFFQDEFYRKSVLDGIWTIVSGEKEKHTASKWYVQAGKFYEWHENIENQTEALRGNPVFEMIFFIYDNRGSRLDFVTIKPNVERFLQDHKLWTLEFRSTIELIGTINGEKVSIHKVPPEALTESDGAIEHA